MNERPIYQTSTFTLAAGAETSFQGSRYLRILTTTGAVTLVSSMANDFGPVGAALPACVQIMGVLLPTGERGPIGPVRFRNDGAVSITFTVATANAPIDDSRDLNGTGGSVTIAGLSDVEGAAAEGAVPAGNPLRMGGTDGAAMRTFRVDTLGRVQSSSAAAAEGAAASGNPLRIGGWDGTNILTIKTDASGFIRCRVTDGTNHMPTMDAGARRGFFQLHDGTTAAGVIVATTALKTDLSSVAGTATVTAGVSGLLAVGGNVASGAVLAGNPVRVGASDGTNVTNIMAKADNATAANGVLVNAVRFDTAPRALNSGNMGAIAADAGGAMVRGNSNKPTFTYTLAAIAATTGTWNALTIEQPASATKWIILKRLTILNPGAFTSAQLTKISVIRTTAAATAGDGAGTVQKRDTADTATAVVRYGAAAACSITGSTVDEVLYMYSPTALAAAAPLVFDFTNNGTEKGIVVPKTNLAGICFQIGGAAGGVSLAIKAEWTEE